MSLSERLTQISSLRFGLGLVLAGTSLIAPAQKPPQPSAKGQVKVSFHFSPKLGLVRYETFVLRETVSKKPTKQVERNVLDYRFSHLPQHMFKAVISQEVGKVSKKNPKYAFLKQLAATKAILILDPNGHLIHLERHGMLPVADGWANTFNFLESLYHTSLQIGQVVKVSVAGNGLVETTSYRFAGIVKVHHRKLATFFVVDRAGRDISKRPAMVIDLDTGLVVSITERATTKQGNVVTTRESAFRQIS